MTQTIVPQVKAFAKSAVRVAVIYDSRGGTTKRVAESILKGVMSVEGASADLLSAEEATEKKGDIVEYDGFILGSPTFMGSVSSGLKAFLETTGLFFVTRQLENKLAGGFTNSGSIAGDKQGTLIQLFTYASQQGMIWVPLGLPAVNNKKVFDPTLFNRGGSFSGLATQSYMDAEPGTGPDESELGSARFYGERFAKVALQYYK